MTVTGNLHLFWPAKVTTGWLYLAKCTSKLCQRGDSPFRVVRATNVHFSQVCLSRMFQKWGWNTFTHLPVVKTMISRPGHCCCDSMWGQSCIFCVSEEGVYGLYVPQHRTHHRPHTLSYIYPPHLQLVFLSSNFSEALFKVPLNAASVAQQHRPSFYFESHLCLPELPPDPTTHPWTGC